MENDPSSQPIPTTGAELRTPKKDDAFFVANAGRMFMLLSGVDHHPPESLINDALRLEIQKLFVEAYDDGIDTIGVSERGLADDDRVPDQSEPPRPADQEPDGDTINRVFLATMDPTVTLEGRPFPAVTTLLNRVCDNDGTKFHEASRIVELFIVEALKYGRQR